MQPENNEVYIIILTGALVAIMMVGFVITLLFTYKRKQKKQKAELQRIKEDFEKESAKSQIEIQENTMQQIAEELHHGIKNDLAGIALYLNVLGMEHANPQITETANNLNTVIEELRAMAHSLHTSQIIKIGLLEALDLEVKKLQRQKHIETIYDCNVNENFFDSQTTIFIYRMVQELLQNILKHAKATQINIRVLCEKDAIFVIEIIDNGIGFEVEEAKHSTKTGVGLTSIANRSALIGGSLSINSTITVGTTVNIKIPIPPNSVSKNGEF